MPLNRNILHPRLFESLRPSFWRHTVTIQVRTDTTLRNSIGGMETDETLNPWITLTGHANISCNLGRKSEALGEILTEERQAFSTYDAKLPRAQLNGRYPLITETMRAVIDGTDVYNIRGVITDSSLSQTELVLEIIT